MLAVQQASTWRKLRLAARGTDLHKLALAGGREIAVNPGHVQRPP